MKAYFTIEAALILPFTLGIYVLIIYTMFFQYDRCLLEQDTAVLAIEGATFGVRDNEEAARLAKRQAAGMDWNRYLAFLPGERKLRVTQGKVTVLSNGSVEMPFWKMGEWFDDGHWRIQASMDITRFSPTLVIRTCRKLLCDAWEE